MTEIDDTTYHIYAKEKCLYCNLTEEEAVELINIFPKTMSELR